MSWIFPLGRSLLQGVWVVLWFIPAWVRNWGTPQCVCADQCWRSFSAGMKFCGQVGNNLGYIPSSASCCHCATQAILGPLKFLSWSCSLVVLEMLQKGFVRLFYEVWNSFKFTRVHLHKRMWITNFGVHLTWIVRDNEYIHFLPWWMSRDQSSLKSGFMFFFATRGYSKAFMWKVMWKWGLVAF